MTPQIPKQKEFLKAGLGYSAITYSTIKINDKLGLDEYQC